MRLLCGVYPDERRVRNDEPIIRRVPIKPVFILFAVFVSVINSNAQQMINYGSNTIISPGVFVCVEGNLINEGGGTVNNSGNILLSGNYTNNSTFLSGNNSYVKLTGASQDIGGSVATTFENLVIGGSADKTISIATNVNDSLIFSANHILIGNNNLTLFQNAVHSGTSNTSFVVTNGNGSLFKKALTSNTVDTLFPVGYTATMAGYKPATINNLGTVDTFSVRVTSGLQPTTGSDPSCVQYTWFVEESNPGGSNASLSLGWNSPDEGTSFIRNSASIWQYKSSAWSMVPGTPGASSNLPGTDWHLRASGITDFSSGANRFILMSYSGISLISQDYSKSVCGSGPDTVSFSVTAKGPGIHYQWQENCGSGWTALSDNATYSGTQTDSLTIINPVAAQNGCKFQCIMENLIDTIISQPATLDVGTASHAFAAIDTTIYIGSSVQFVLSGGISYQWSPPTYLDNPNIADPTSTPLNSITYIVTITSKQGCTDEDTITVTVNTEETNIWVPNIFAPDGPPVNRVLYVRGSGIKDLEFVVYDRWGEKVFESNDILQGWDGTFKGEMLSTAVFVYYVKATYFNGAIVEKKGNVTLMR
jgi:gliding motility-associated-like protein